MYLSLNSISLNSIKFQRNFLFLINILHDKEESLFRTSRKMTGTCDPISDTFTSDVRDYCPEIPETIC